MTCCNEYCSFKEIFLVQCMIYALLKFLITIFTLSSLEYYNTDKRVSPIRLWSYFEILAFCCISRSSFQVHKASFIWSIVFTRRKKDLFLFIPIAVVPGSADGSGFGSTWRDCWAPSSLHWSYRGTGTSKHSTIFFHVLSNRVTAYRSEGLFQTAGSWKHYT